MQNSPTQQALVSQHNFKLTLFIGVVCSLIGTLMISTSHPDLCKEYRMRYCDYEDSDMNICYSRGDLYCCHSDRNDHSWNRRYEDDERRSCGGHDNCYRIFENVDNDGDE